MKRFALIAACNAPTVVVDTSAPDVALQGPDAFTRFDP
jgi:hypothetical protein